MDFFLFEKYGLSEKENDNAVIEKALESHKEKEGWEAKLNSKNDKIRSRAKEEKQRWTEDRELLLDKQARETYLKEYYDAVREIVEYINDNEGEDSSFEEIAAIQGITADIARSIYEKHKNLGVKEDVDLNEVQELAFKINKVQNAYNALVGKCDASVKDKFLENNVNINTLFDALSVTSCGSAKEIEANSYKVSKLAYDLYNKQLFSSDIKNGFMDIFDAKSTKETAVVSFIGNENLDKHFSLNNWILLRYIRTTCTLMKKSGSVGEQKIATVSTGDRGAFAQAMKQVFGVTIEVSKSTEFSPSEHQAQVPIEVAQGENELKRGQFGRAKALFSQASNKDPYCWQAYWGMFKASVEARTNDEIYFPGFIDKLRLSETEGSGPEYIDYYKSAKFNAAAQRSRDINFTSIEMEYKKADQVNAEFRKAVGEIKETYESADADQIKSQKGKSACQKLHVKDQEHIKWVTVYAKGNMMNYALLILSVCIINFGLVFTQIDFFASGTLNEIIGLISMIGPVLIAFFAGGIIATVITAAISIGGVYLIDKLCSEFFVLRIIFVTVFLVGGMMMAMHAFRKIKDYRSSEEKANAVLGEMEEAKDDIMNALIEEIAVLYKRPIIEKYRIPFPVDETFDFSKYITSDEEIYSRIQEEG